MNLEIPEGSRLESAESEDLGVIRHFVVRPSTSELTHVLVEKGVFFTDDRVVPVETIDRVDDEVVVLRDDVDPSTLPRFVRDQYALVEDDTSSAPTSSHYVWRYPTALAGPYPIYPAYPMPTGSTKRDIDDPRTRDRLAESEIIGPRTPVLSKGGEKVGTVSELQVDETGKLSHLVVDLGFLDGEKVLPEHWIDVIETDGVHLAVRDDALQTLETIT